METFKASRQGDRRKTPEVRTYRSLTREEVLALEAGEHSLCVLNNGSIGEVKINGTVRRWKREPDRVEVPVKYGMYEHATLSLAEAIHRLCIEVHEPEEGL